MKKKFFVLGGPCSGKGLLCSNIMRTLSDSIHFSAGELLRNFVSTHRNSQDLLKKQRVDLINETILRGKIVPAHITIELLREEIARSQKGVVFVDGFPRNFDNFLVWREARGVGGGEERAIFLDCSFESL